MRARLFDVVTAASAALFVGVVAMWADSGWTARGLNRSRLFVSGPTLSCEAVSAVSDSGGLSLSVDGVTVATTSTDDVARVRTFHLWHRCRGPSWSEPARGYPFHLGNVGPTWPRRLGVEWLTDRRAVGGWNARSAAVTVPDCLPAVVFGAAPLAWLWRRVGRRRRRRAGLCPACGYDLRASAGRCPECGAVAWRG